MDLTWGLLYITYLAIDRLCAVRCGINTEVYIKVDSFRWCTVQVRLSQRLGSAHMPTRATPLWTLFLLDYPVGSR